MFFSVLKRTATVCLAFGVAGCVRSSRNRGRKPACPWCVQSEPNSAAAQKAHYVVLVSLDGFRWDYARHDGAVNLLALGKKGVWAPQGMLPSFPSLTFPNHFTIVTEPRASRVGGQQLLRSCEASALWDLRCKGRAGWELV